MPDRLVCLNVFPDLLGLYGDSGNALALSHRASLHGVELSHARLTVDNQRVPRADIVLIGGAEDSSMGLAGELLGRLGEVAALVRDGVPTFAVCAGFQLLGHSYSGRDGKIQDGLGLLDVESRRISGPRAVGELVSESSALGTLTGFENHQGDARLGGSCRPLGAIRTGVGNGVGQNEGAIQGSIIGTYMHGPALVRNPRLADRLLEMALGRDLPAITDPQVERLRRERLAAASHRRRGRRARLTG